MLRKMVGHRFRAVSLVIAVWTGLVLGAAPKPIVLDEDYHHDRWVTKPVDIKRQFRAYVVSFDSEDDNDGDGVSDRWGIPEWVAYEIKKQDKSVKGKSAARPRDWITDQQLYKKKLCPNDSSYHFSMEYRKKNPNCDMLDYDRGHMCMKQIASRLGKDADWNSHSLLNACPQHKILNQGIWKELEQYTMTWADKYGSVWVICGPILKDRKVTKWLGESKEIKVAIPDAFFKIVIAEGQDVPRPTETDDTLTVAGSGTTITTTTISTTSQPADTVTGIYHRPRVLAFMFPQEDPRYKKKPLDVKPFLTSVDEIEEQTGLDFLTCLADEIEESVEAEKAKTLWK